MLISNLYLLSFSLFMSPTNGNCYTFNSNSNPDYEEKYVAQTGPLMGLTLVIGLNQKYYMNGGQSHQAGARLAVHLNSEGTTQSLESLNTYNLSM